MANDQFILKEDGYLNIGTESTAITYHSSLNVILVFNRENEVKVLDVHSSVILKLCKLSEGRHRVHGRYLPLQDKILFWDDRNIGLRGDYNCVLLLDTILQTQVRQNDDLIRLEMLLSEAILFQQSLQSLEDNGIECPSDVSNELLEKIKEAQSNVKKSIKAQRWNTVCIELPYSSLKLVANNVVFNLKHLDRHIPALAIASAINERLTDLLAGSRVLDTVNSGNFERFLMYSEAARRQTFEKWPHMDYKWALPDQMAQAGFYHQPSSTGEDRAMCFTCNVCLVCWEKTDEPWSEHERHSPNCPFVKGEYTQNVPLSVTYATSPAVHTDGFNIISNTDQSHIMCTSNNNGEVTIWSLERSLKKMHTFQVKEHLQELINGNAEDAINSVRITAIGVLPMFSNADSSQNTFTTKSPSISPKVNMIGSKFVLGLTVNRSTDASDLYLATFVVIDAENPNDTPESIADMIKTELIDKNKFEKDLNLSKIVAEENFDSGLLKLSDFGPWKMTEGEKSFYLDFDDSSTKVGISCKIIDDTEKVLKQQELSKIENVDNTKSGTIVSVPKPDVVNCQLIGCTRIDSPASSQSLFSIADILSVNDGKELLVKLLRTDSSLIDLEDETLKMEVDEDVTTTPESVALESQLRVYALDENGLASERALNSRDFNCDKSPREICILPKADNSSNAAVDTAASNSVCCLVCSDGTLELLQLNSLDTIANVCLKNEKIISATYCKSLERLCGCTKNGSLIFYALHDTDRDSIDEMMDDENHLLITSDTSLTGCEQDVSEIDGASASPKIGKKQAENSQSNASTSNIVGAAGDSSHSSPTPVLLANKTDLTVFDLQSLYSLTLFDEMLTPYNAEVPGCWNELVQAQKQRRHPQHVRPGDDTHLTKTWRLHNDATTWDEHIIELSLIKPSNLGHIDLKFSLYQQCPNPPAIQVTLLKQNTSGFGYRMKSHHTINVSSDTAVDDNIDFNLIDSEGSNENPVLTEEYLQANNAEILAGPIELSSCMDLCDQGGLVTLTSPKLFKTRARNFLLHIKTMADPSKDGQGKTRVPVRKKGVMRFLFSSFANNPSQNSTNATYSQNSSSNKQSRNDYYIGCDWLHEISITVRSTKPDNKIINDRVQRIAMLESNGFLENLLKFSCDTSKLQQNISLDILIWICTIRLMRFRSPKISDRGGGGGGAGGGTTKYKSSETPQKSTSGATAVNFADTTNTDMASQQRECVGIVEQHLKKLILSCIINGDRTLAHKAVKLILIVSEGVRNLPNDIHQKYSFDASLRIAIVSSLPFITTTKYSSAVRWFTFLISATSSPESQAAISECCIKLLMNITAEIDKRFDPCNALLGSRYGLYGFPFERDIFDLELPSFTRTNSTPNTLANIIKSNAGLMQPGGLDIKKISSIDGVELRSFPHLIKRKGISNQVRGLLEVEPLHFTCFAASEATRIENMDSLTSSTASNINMEEIVTSTPLYNNADGFFDAAKKDVDKDNANDDAMNNVKNILVDKFFTSALKKYKLKDELVTIKPNGVVEPIESFPVTGKPQFPKSKPSQYQEPEESSNPPSEDANSEVKLANKIKKYMTESGNNDEYNNIFSWHKLLSVPPKQMVVIDRIHSGARRYVVIDFGSPILLTDLVIPACDELASLFIDIWCLDEETDSTRLVATQDIGVKTLVLSDLQPPPICRYMKITIIGRYGMAATRCKIPIGYFYGHVIILESDAYADPLLNYVKANSANIAGQVKALKSLYEDVHCRYSLSSCKLTELLTPILNSELSNIAHMHAYINKLKEDDNQIDNAKIVGMYDECISLQHQLNIIRNVIDRLENALDPNITPTPSQTLAAISRDKLRTLSESLVEILLHFTIEYGTKNIYSLHSYFNINVANTLFNTLVVSGDAHIQLATCSLLVRMCCFQSWWGDFLANIFCTLYSSQNSRIFPQDRVFFLLSYLGRKSIMMGTCRSIVIDAILKTVAKLLAPISPRFNRNVNLGDGESNDSPNSSLWTKSDLQLITWLLLFLSVCLDGSVEKKDKSINRWEFMSCETDLSKSRPQSSSNSGKTLPRCFKKRIIQQNKYNGIQSYTDWSKKMYMLQNELPEIFMELTGKSKPKISKPNAAPKPSKEPPIESQNSFDQGLKCTKIANLLVVIRGLIGLILDMDFTCNMDLFLLTCKVIARLVSACKPSIQLSKVMTANQLEQLIRLAVWNDQQQPWAVHTITCLLQDLLDADKNFKEPFESEIENNDPNSMEGVIEIDDSIIEISEPSQSIMHNSQVVKDISYADTVKYGQLPSLIECEDAELDELLHEIDIVDRGRNILKKDNLSQSKNSFNFFCKSVSNAMDSRLDYGLDTNVEILIRRLTMTPSLDLYDSLPQIPTSEMDYSSSELLAWPEGITSVWSGPEYNNGIQTYEVFRNVFENIFVDLHLQDTWVNLEQLLQLWLTLNSELAEKPYSCGISPSNVPKIIFGVNGVRGLLLALAWHSDIKLRTWCLGFQCLTLACNAIVVGGERDSGYYNMQKIGDVIVRDENFEKMLLRFFSGYGMNSSAATNRCAGPTICKYLHDLLTLLSINVEFTDSTTGVRRKFKDTLLNVVLQLVQPAGAISNQQGPIDAQSQLVRDLISIHYDKADLNVAMSIIESVSFLVYNNISNSEKIFCQRSNESGTSNNTFGNLFATVLGSDNSKQNITVSDSLLLVSLLKLSASLVQTELERRVEEVGVSVIELTNESQTDETKAENRNNPETKIKVPCVADTVLRHFPTMKRLLGCLSHCNSSSFSLFISSSLYQINITEISSSLNEPQTTADAVFHLLMLLCTKASQTNLIVTPIYQYLESNSSPRNILPRLQLSEPFLWYVLKVLESPSAVSVFNEMGGMKILCQNLIKCNKVLTNMQPGLISLIMQHMTKSNKIKYLANGATSSISAKKAQSGNKGDDGVINFAPFCTISSENSTAQPADVLIQTPIASHRRARTPAWSYMFYPNESYVDLTLTLPTAIMLMEIQVQPHLPSLASCPSAIAVEISRDCGLGPIPIGQAHTTVGMTFIRLKLARPEIASSIVLRLYRPKDSSNIGLTQISVLGTTIFNACKYVPGSETPVIEDDSFAKTSVGWIRILARCFSVAMFTPDSPLVNSVVTAAAEYPRFLEACCTLLNIMPLCSNIALQNLETVLLKLGTHNRTLSLSLVQNLLTGTMPQVYRLCNEAVCDLLYDLCTKTDAYTPDRISVLLDWVARLNQNIEGNSAQQINPQTGLMKCIASVLWTAHSNRSVSNLHELVTDNLFEICFHMIEVSHISSALKTAFDSLLCSLCYARPELFSKLLINCGYIERMRMEGMTDDTKEANSSNAIPSNNTNYENLTKLLENVSLLNTVSLACQSTLAVQLLIESNLPRKLAQAIHEFCCSVSPEVGKISPKNRKISNCSLTDSDKAENVKIDDTPNNSVLKVQQLPEVLDFFSNCCAEGQMRDWLGSYQGSIFWKALLELLCNHRPNDSNVEPLQHYFTRIERATINFFTRVTACHPKNQENLTLILISVIKKPPKLGQPSSNLIISGFTRRLVLQLLLESEKILVSIRSQMPLQKRSNSLSLVNNHPSKRTNTHHLLFYLSSHTKCQDLLQSCVSIYSSMLPPIGTDTKPPDVVGPSSAAKSQSDNRKELLEMGLGMGPHGMEFLSVVAGVTAKDKRLKDVKNQAAAALKENDLYSNYARLPHDDFFAANVNNQMSTCTANCLQFQHEACPDVLLTSDTSLSQILALLFSRGHSLSTPCLELELVSKTNQSDEYSDESLIKAANVEPLTSPLQRFSSRGGLSLLAHYLPTVFPENIKGNTSQQDKEKSPPANDWVKVEQNDEIYEDLEDSTTETTSKLPTITSVPQHSLAAFGLFLRLPAYSDVLLRDKLRAQCLLRLVLGVTGDGEGNDIYSLSLAPSLPTLPFEVFKQLLDSSPLTTDDGVLLRRMVIEVGAMHLVLNCLGIFTHQSNNYQITGPQADVTNGVKNSGSLDDQVISDDKSHVYWAKGTGFGTGSTQQSWDVEQALLRQKSEEEHVTVLLQVLSSYINPGDRVPKYLNCDDIMGYHEVSDIPGELPSIFLDLLQQSCLVPALSSYLRNDSVLDITRHIPLYRAILQLLRALALSGQLMGLLQPKDPGEESTSIVSLLANMKTCVDTYAKRLKVNKKSNIKGQTQKVTVNIDDGDDEGLALLIPDIQETTLLVQRASNVDAQSSGTRESDKGYADRPLSSSIEQRYLEVMKKMQFDTYEMMVECENGYRFVVSHHFENNVRITGDRGHPSRVKRLAQETVTLSTSLPLSYSSSVFVRCDTDRLDIMKVLITGPADTPYANGCFEFDVYFPADYPNSPMLINLETTGRHTVRFNPNLYNDGKVCLSVLNTWHGRPEEKWNAQTSSFLQVLVSIQSLILVPEPYFNEPGFERSRNTPSGTHCSREYNSNIYQACVRWAMIEQIRNPSPCFKEVIHMHFWLKRQEICNQIEGWIAELNKPQYAERSGRAISFNSMVLRRQYRQLREELAKLPVPEGLEDLDAPLNPHASSFLGASDSMSQQSPTQSAQRPSQSQTSNDVEDVSTASTSDITSTLTQDTASQIDDDSSSITATEENASNTTTTTTKTNLTNWELHTT